ncbi:MAG: hypothetical protein PG981_000315 [Wolbachia endosymbiont of Ctenocephalides orientis wCori]|nr:MAG: hypothetical protein PG981_000315 [Wolbachia endosymbiont of Ctenocephalides orientis wCori]
MECLLYVGEQLKHYCQGLNDKERQELYNQILVRAKEAIKDTQEINQAKMLSRAAVVIEEIIGKESIELSNPFRNVNIVTYTPEGSVNYLFSTGDSSELYDVREDREKALYQAIKSNDLEILKHLFKILVPESIFLERLIELEISIYGKCTNKIRDIGADDIRRIDLKYLKELEILLQKFYEELKPNLTKDMENYLQKKLIFYHFVCEARVSEKTTIDLIKLFVAQSEINYQIDLLLLSLIAEDMEELREEINNMIDLLGKYRKFEELEYKVRRLKLELASGKADKESLERWENEMREIEEKYIKVTDLASELVKQLQQILN